MTIVFGKSFLYTCATTTIAIPSIMNIFPRDSIMCIITIHIMSVYGMYRRHDLHCQIELTIWSLRVVRSEKDRSADVADTAVGGSGAEGWLGNPVDNIL